jgi:membrane-bound metal-dependent hydrolase YbcI (DUF457 family)
LATRTGFTSTLLWAAGLAFVFASASFLWSLLGFASPVPPVHFHEYAFPALVTEVGGHVLFGVIAAALALDVGLALLAGGESVLIDSDHLLAALGYPVAGRFAHSIFFALAAALLLGYLARRNGGPGRGVFVVTLSSVLAHMGYDSFAGNGFFYFFSPFSFSSYEFPYWTWPFLFVASALLCASLGSTPSLLRRMALRRKVNEGGRRKNAG